MSGIFDPTFPVPHGLSAVVSLFAHPGVGVLVFSVRFWTTAASWPSLPSSTSADSRPSPPSLFRRRYVC